MKITKSAVAVSLSTFIIGCVSVFAYISFVQMPEMLDAEVEPSINVSVVCFTKEAALPVEPQPEEDWLDASKFKIKLLETGEGFHGDDVDAKNGETWLGLFEENGQYRLRSTKLKVRRSRDEVVDLLNQKTGKSVGTQYPAKSLFLLKNAESLHEGKIETVFRGLPFDETQDFDQRTLLVKGFNQQYRFGNGKTYALRVEEVKTRNNESVLKLILETEGLSQILFSIKSDDSPSLGVLNWVGDLDGDGKLDLYGELYVHENVLYRNLFLSSEAEKGKLLEKVAIFTITGC